MSATILKDEEVDEWIRQGKDVFDKVKAKSKDKPELQPVVSIIDTHFGGIKEILQIYKNCQTDAGKETMGKSLLYRVELFEKAMKPYAHLI